jgi:hypothetical protein
MLNIGSQISTVLIGPKPAGGVAPLAFAADWEPPLDVDPDALAVSLEVAWLPHATIAVIPVTKIIANIAFVFIYFPVSASVSAAVLNRLQFRPISRQHSLRICRRI